MAVILMDWSDGVGTFLKLVVIGAISGGILAAVMKVICRITGNKADILLYNMDYIPILKQWSDKKITGILFHYGTCIASAVVLYYLAHSIRMGDGYMAIYPCIYCGRRHPLFPQCIDGYAAGTGRFHGMVLLDPWTWNIRNVCGSSDHFMDIKLFPSCENRINSLKYLEHL